MNVKRFFAPDMRQAIRLVREAQGPDAVILSNRKVEGGIEIIAAPIALLNSLRLPTWPSETSVFVTVVPMFAPIIIGIALETLRPPEPTMPTTIEVVVEELWTMLVASMPIRSPTKGLEVVLTRFSAKSFPKPLKAAPIRPMLSRKK